MIKIICDDEDYDHFPIQQVFRKMNASRRYSDQPAFTRISTYQQDGKFVIEYGDKSDD